MLRLDSENLAIIPLDTRQMDLLLENPSALETELGLRPGMPLEQHTLEAMQSIREKAARTPDSFPWLANWQIILKSENSSIGSACFMDVPDCNGMAEIGYGIFPQYKNRGYMTEALAAIIKWAANQPGMGILVAQTEDGNAPSQRVLEKCSFIPCNPAFQIRVLDASRVKAGAVEAAFLAAKSPEEAKKLMSFFKTGPGQYGEGDVFLGIKAPRLKAFVKAFAKLPLPQIQILLHSQYHEIRACALAILSLAYPKADNSRRQSILKLYLDNTECINNWDLVDLSAPAIVGQDALDNGTSRLDALACGPSLWEKRIAIVSTLTLIRNNSLEKTFELAKLIMQEKHDLLHKAAGWMLREAGKRNMQKLLDFLDAFATSMPRTMLRYAIEKMPEETRKYYLNLKN